MTVAAPIFVTHKRSTALSAHLMLNCLQIRQILKVQTEVHLCPYMKDDTLSLFTQNSLYNDINNQQDATTFAFINLFKSAQHVSGDKFAHPQEHFLTVYTAFGTMHHSVLYQKLYIQPKKKAPEDG